MKTGTATDQMAVTYETQCKHCLIAKTYRRYAPKTTNQGVYHNKVWSCTEFARLLHKIRFFFLGQMNVLLWTPYTSLGDVICFNYIAFHILDVEHLENFNGTKRIGRAARREHFELLDVSPGPNHTSSDNLATKKYLLSDIIVVSFVVGTDFWVIFKCFFD